MGGAWRAPGDAWVCVSWVRLVVPRAPLARHIYVGLVTLSVFLLTARPNSRPSLDLRAVPHWRPPHLADGCGSFPPRGVRAERAGCNADHRCGFRRGDLIVGHGYSSGV